MMIKAKLALIFSPVCFGPKFDGFGINRGLILNLSYITPKRHILLMSYHA